jgi:hypothetical protein
MTRVLVCIACASIACALTPDARAEEAKAGAKVEGKVDGTTDGKLDTTASLEPEKTIKMSDRPHTVAELEAGIIALPDAPISRRQQGGDTPLGGFGKGDATLQTGVHLLYRGKPEWAIGAGFLFGPSPTSDKEYGGLRNLPRTHSRSYLFIGTEGRYVPLRTKSLEAWVGLTGGIVVIADRFVSDGGEKVPPILGTREVTIRTEGFGLGVQAGGSWMFADNWVTGLTARTDRWFLPDSPQCSAIGDCATLTGSVAVFELGVTIGYRLPL